MAENAPEPLADGEPTSPLDAPPGGGGKAPAREARPVDPARASDPSIEAAWQQVRADWDDEEAHRRFRALCAAVGRLPEAGRRYREVRERDPDPARRAAAERHIDALLALATSTLEHLRTPPRDLAGQRRGLFLAALLVATALVIVAMLAWSA